MSRHFRAVLSLCVLVLTVALVGGYAGAQESVQTTPEAADQPLEEFDPNNFDNPTVIDNEWYPLQPGTYWAYEGFTVEDGETLSHRLEFVVTDLTKIINGVRTVVIWIVDYSDGEMVEKEIAFYAQDNDGAVWYFGEHPEEYEDGKFVAAPTWIAGLAEARAGIKMLADPQPEMPGYSQGWGPAVDWTDRAQVDAIVEEFCVPVDCFQEVLVIAETSAGETGAFQLKYYTRGVGEIGVGWRGDDATQEELKLVEYQQLTPEALETIRIQALALEAHAYEISKDVYAMTSPAEYPPGTPVQVTLTPTPQETPVVAAGPKVGHWEGEVSRTEGDAILFDVLPENEVDNIELEMTVDGAECVAEIELTPLLPDGTFALEAADDTNGITGTFDSATTATGTVIIHDCSGIPVPEVSGSAEYTWTAEWVSDEVG